MALHRCVSVDPSNKNTLSRLSTMRIFQHQFRGWTPFTRIARFTTSVTPALTSKVAPVTEPTRPAKEMAIPNVKAFYIAKSLNLKSLANHYGQHQQSVLNTEILILRLAENNNYHGHESFATFYAYGSVVFFNCTQAIMVSNISVAKRHSTGFFAKSLNMSTEELLVIKNPKLSSWSIYDSGELVLQELDINNIRVISHVLGQSVALSYYEKLVDEILKKYQHITENQPEVSVVSYNRTMLLKLLRESNSLLAEIILKLGILDRTKLRDSAWKYDTYFTVWEALREEFEVKDRWEIINTKSEYLKSNMKFFIEVLNTEKSLRLERIIIFLIGAELLLNLYATLLPT